ncbi:hypothetical protein Tco_0437972 [Tanacetum coccineum]
MLDSLTSSMCIESWGRSSFAHCLIEVKVDEALKDSAIGIPLPDGMGFTKETVRVEYEWKPPCCEQCKIFGHVYDQCPKNAIVIPNVDKMNNDGFQRWLAKESVLIKPKVRYEPKAHGNLPNNGAPKGSTSAKDDPSKKQHAKKGGPHVPTSKPSVLTFNPYDV